MPDSPDESGERLAIDRGRGGNVGWQGQEGSMLDSNVAALFDKELGLKNDSRVEA